MTRFDPAARARDARRQLSGPTAVSTNSWWLRSASRLTSWRWWPAVPTGPCRCTASGKIQKFRLRGLIAQA